MARVPLDKNALQAGELGGRNLLSPGEGVRLYVYDRGTTAPVTGYTTEAGTTEVAYPLTSDEDGSFEAWYPPGDYDLFSPDDTLNATEPWNAVSSDTGVFDATAFGAVGDGVTDDQAAIQAAFDAAEAVVDGDTAGAEVFLPPGRYSIESKLRIGNKVKLRGAGPYSSTIYAASTFNETAMIENKDRGATLQQAASIEGVDFYGNKGNGAVVSNAGVDFKALFIGTELRNVLVRNTSNHGVEISSSTQAGAGAGPLFLDSVQTNLTDGDGIRVYSPAGAFTIDDVLLINCLTENFGASKAGVRLQTTDTGIIWGTTIIRHHVEVSSSGAKGIVIDGAPNTSIYGFTMKGVPTGSPKGLEITNNALNLRIVVENVNNQNVFNPILDDLKNSKSFAGVNLRRYMTSESSGDYFGTQAAAIVTGSRGGNAALASLLTQLAALGLITDSSS